MATAKGLGDYYDVVYGRVGRDLDLYAELRSEVFGEDIGQNSWVTLDDLGSFAAQLKLGPSSRLLDIACGSGGPALHIVRLTCCEIVGVDVAKNAVKTAKWMAREAGLEERASFLVADASKPLPLESESFDAILCIEAVSHLPDRARAFAEWMRLMRPGGRLLFTDPFTVTGPLGSNEIAIRASIGYYLFVPLGEDERLLTETGLQVLAIEDGTERVAEIAGRWHRARLARAAELRRAEGDAVFDARQRSYEVAAAIAREHRLSRFVYLAEKPR